MILSPYAPLPKHRKKIKVTASVTQQKCTLFSQYTPKPGGQTAVWEFLKFREIHDCGVRALWVRGGIGCIAGETLINGIPVIEQQQNPIKVETMMGSMWATPAYCKGEANLYRVILESGKSVTVTGHHQMLTLKGWQRLQDLDCGVLVGVHDNEHDDQQLEITRDCQYFDQMDSHYGGESPFDHLINLQSEILQIFGIDTWHHHHNILYPHSIENYVAGFLLHLYAFEHPFFLTFVEFVHDLIHNVEKVLHTSSHLDIFEQLHPWVDPFYVRKNHNQNLWKTRVSLQYFQLNLLKHQTFQQSLGHFYMLCKTQPIQALAHLLEFVSALINPIWFSSDSHYHHIPKWEKIVAIEYDRYDFFYDLHVPIANHYNAHGIWHHNSGKSHLASAYVCSRAYLDPKSRGLISANSYSQLETSTLVALASFCEQFSVPISPKRATVEETAKAIAAKRLVRIFDASLFVLSAEAFLGATTNSSETGRGLEVKYAWGDEYAYAPHSVWQTLNGRIGRGPGSIKGFALITSSINRNNPYNWCYDLFDKPKRTAEITRLYKSINCITRDNDSLDPDYIDGLTASYTPELIAIELMGEYAIMGEGVICRYFNRHQHTAQTQLAPGDIHVSCDFNCAPASSLIFQLDGDRIIVHREIHLKDADTFQLGDALVSVLNEFIPQCQEAYPDPIRLHLYGDATGNIKTANSQLSNWQIIWKKLKPLGVEMVKRYKAANPPVIDTLNSLNALISHNRVIIDENCDELIKDLESCRYDAKGGIDKKIDLLRSHWLDELRYAAHTLYPLKFGLQDRVKGGGINTDVPSEWEEFFDGY